MVLGLGQKTSGENLPICTSSPLDRPPPNPPASPVDVGAVEATDVRRRGIRRSPHRNSAWPAAHGDVVEKDVGCRDVDPPRSPADPAGTGIRRWGPVFTTISAEPGRQRLDPPETALFGAYRRYSVRFVEEVCAGERRSGFPPVTSSSVWSRSFSVTPRCPFFGRLGGVVELAPNCSHDRTRAMAS